MVDTLVLHRTRVERGIDLAEVAARTSLNPVIVQSIDRGRFEALPAGVYARSYVRAFAVAVGLQPEQVVRQLEPSLPRVDDPLPVLREIARGAMPDWPDRIAQTGRDVGNMLTALAARALATVCERGRGLAIRRLLVPLVTHLGGQGTLCRFSAVRCAAACLDAAVLLVLLAVVVQLTAWTSASAGGEVLVVAGEEIAALWGVLAFLYFVILGGVGGRTLGGAVCGIAPPGTHELLRLRAILERAMLH